MRIAIVNDSAIAIETLRKIIESSGIHKVAWVAHDGAEALNKCKSDMPSLILMDLLMPVMNGAESTKNIMHACPCSILIVTASVAGNASLVFEAMSYGALDVINTPSSHEISSESGVALLKKIATIEKLTKPTTPRLKSTSPRGGSVIDKAGDSLLVIGSSTGGPGALSTMLSQLPADFPAGIVVVQHVDEHFAGELAQWLNNQTKLSVRLAEAGNKPVPGVVLLAGTNDHLIMNKRQQLVYTPIPRDQIYRPSVDVFFDSIAQCWKGEVTAVLLTGMGRDGGLGLLRLREAGAYTIAEHESTCAVYGMPKAAVELHAAIDVLPLQDIAKRILQKYRGALPRYKADDQG